MRDFEDFGEEVASGGTMREYIERRLVTDEEDIHFLEDVIGNKPDRPSEAPVTYHDLEEGSIYMADYSSSESRIVEFSVSDDKEMGVLNLIEV